MNYCCTFLSSKNQEKKLTQTKSVLHKAEVHFFNTPSILSLIYTNDSTQILGCNQRRPVAGTPHLPDGDRGGGAGDSLAHACPYCANFF